MEYKNTSLKYENERPYEKPIIIKEETMNFPLEIILTACGEKILCR